MEGIMKQVIRCGGCGTITKRAGCFTAELEQQKTFNGIKLPELEKVKVFLCRACAKLAGYKVKGEE